MNAMAVPSPPASTESLAPAALWAVLRREAEEMAVEEPLLARFVARFVLEQDSLPAALSYYLAHKIASDELRVEPLAAVALEAFTDEPLLVVTAARDLCGSRERNPAYLNTLTPFLHFKGFQSLGWHRVAHWLWQRNRHALATYLQSRVSEVFAVDIHPAARIGCGVFIDHATGVVIGETAVVESEVSLLHSVTLGGTGKERGDRHPKVRRGVLIGAGAKVLGNIEVGEGAKVGAGSVVLHSVPPHTTVAGVPARVVGRQREAAPALTMDQCLPEHE